MLHEKFLTILNGLEKEILSTRDYSPHTQRVLQELIKYVENCTFSKSIHSKFICSNFRCRIKELQLRWNELHGDKKSEEAFRAQISTISKQLYAMFGTDLVDVFLREDEDKLNVLEWLLKALSGNADNVKDYLCGEVVDGVADINWDRTYSIDELIPVIRAISPYSKSYISEVLTTLDKKKLSYVLYVLKRPLTSNTTRTTSEPKMEILRELTRNTKKEEPVDTFMEILRKVSENNNGFEDNQDNRNYLRKLFNAYKAINNIDTIIEKRKISSRDVFVVLYEMKGER